MKIMKIKNANNIGWIIVLLVILLLYISFFLVFIPQQESNVQERSFRILKEYAQNIHDKQNYYQTHLENYGIFYTIRKNPLIPKGSNTREVIKGLEKSIAIDTVSEEERENLTASFYNNTDFENINFYLGHKSFSSKSNNFGNDVNKNLKNKIANLPVTTLMEGLKFDKLFENIAFLDSFHVLNNSNGNVVNDITNTQILLDTISKKQGGIYLKIKINGVKNHVMILPITFLNKTFYLAGFISDNDFRKKTRTINSQFLTIISGLLLLILVGMPILKIIFINEKERLNVRDTHYATLSLILVFSLLMLLFIGTMKYYFIDRSTARERIEDISEKIIKNVEDDFNELISLGDLLANKKITNNAVINSTKSIFLQDTLRYDTIPKLVLNKHFPINEIILINDKGIAIKAATSTVFPDRIPLDLQERMYYKSLKDLELGWPFKSKFASRYFIESIKSYNTGDKETAISFKLNTTCAELLHAPFLAITSHIPSLYEQVLPKDVAFVIMNSTGKVLFHSDQSKNLHENFLIESNNSPKIKGAVNYRTIETTEITYNEKKWLARIVPMSEKPLYHVTLLDLEKTDDKNTRIYLFTFYFLLFTFICIWAGMQIIQNVKPKENFVKSKLWAFEWLLFHPFNYQLYRSLFIVQILVLFLQILGMLIINRPVEMLFFQLIFITFSTFVALEILGSSTHKNAKRVVLFTVFIFVVPLFFWLKNWNLIIPIFILAILFWLTQFAKRKAGKEIISTPEKAKKTYLAYMFVWLACLTFVPVISNYYSIKYQEEKLAEQNKMLHVAQKNLNLKDFQNKKWYNRITCNNLDDLTVSDTSFYPKTPLVDTLNKADFIYSKLLNPITKNGYLMALLKDQNKNAEWLFKGSTLYYSVGEKNNKIVVSSEKLEKLNSFFGKISTRTNLLNLLLWFLYFALPILFLTLFALSLFQYLANAILNTVIVDWVKPKIPKWKTFLQSGKVNRILLLSFEDNNYRLETAELFQTLIITADQIKEKSFDIESLISANDKVIWINQLNADLLQIENYPAILKNLSEIDKIAKDKIVIIETPIDTDFINEYFADYILEYQNPKEKEIQILNATRNLVNAFKSYYRFIGKIDGISMDSTFNSLSIADENAGNLLANSQVMKNQYNYIWNNLSRIEKMILFDLADDGMLNFKNKIVINRLVTKGLIEMDPSPKLFNPGFQYFLKHSINKEETQILENKLGKQGKWKNTKYIILLLLIPLAGFVFITKGTSIEKVIGIFTGVLALFSGVFRMLDSNLFRSTLK